MALEVKYKEIYTQEGKETEKFDVFGSSGLKRWDIGLGLGAGFEFKGIGINLGYDLGFLNASKNSDYKMRNNTAHITFAYRFR